MHRTPRFSPGLVFVAVSYEERSALSSTGLRAALAALTAYMAKTLTVIFGVILVLLGALGFVSNPLIGANALFAADTAHNIVHIILGAILLLVAFWYGERSELWLKIIGAVTFLLGLIGLMTVPSTGGSLLGIAYTNGASNWFHLVAGAVVFVALVYGREERQPPLAV